MRKNAGLLRGLQYFEAVARHMSVKGAAGELGVTSGAVSRQLRDLTIAVGEQLIARSGRGIALTATGRELAARLSAAFVDLDRSIDDVVGGRKPLVRLAVCTSFGPGWLASRMEGFVIANPDYDLELRLYTQDPYLTDQVADAFVTAGPLAPGFVAVRLFDETLVAICKSDGTSLERKREQRLITTDINIGQEGADWQDFANATGWPLSEFRSGPFFRASHYLLALELAKAGTGAALVPDFLAERDMKAGAIALFDQRRLPSGRTYHLCYKSSRAKEPALVALAAWMKDQAGQSGKRVLRAANL